jgi:hypothetical protein
MTEPAGPTDFSDQGLQDAWDAQLAKLTPDKMEAMARGLKALMEAQAEPPEDEHGGRRMGQGRQYISRG